MGFLSDLAGPVLGGGLGFLVGGPPGAAIGAGLGGAFSGSQAQRSAANTAADATRYGADQSAAIQRYMFDKMLAQQAPYQKAGVEALDIIQDAAPTAPAWEQFSQLKTKPSLVLPEFDFQFDEADPGYQWRQGELEKTINQATAARGNYNSRAAINALAEGNLALSADEYGRQFSRAKDVYGLDYQRTADQYGSEYGKITDLANMASMLGITDYNKWLDIVKIGQGAAGQAGTGALATGQGLGQTYGQLGTNLGNIAMQKGQTESDFWSGLGAMPLNYMLMSNLMGGGGTPAAGGNLGNMGALGGGNMLFPMPFA